MSLSKEQGVLSLGGVDGVDGGGWELHALPIQPPPKRHQNTCPKGPVEKMCFFQGKMLNMLNPGGACWIKMCFFQGKCWICWICWMFWGELGQTPPFLLVLPKAFNIFNISAILSTFWFNMPPQDSTYSTFPLKEAHLWENVFLSPEMLNMLNMLNVLGRTWPKPPFF